MTPLTDEQVRILWKRIMKAIDKGRYYPANTSATHEAFEVLRPYTKLGYEAMLEKTTQ